MTIFREILSQFTNRELAIIFWFGILLFFAFIKRDIRRSISELLFSRFLLQMLFILTSYNLLITFILSKLGVWNIEYFKESLYWFFGSSLVFFFNIKEVDGGKTFFKRILFQMLGLIAVLGFLGNSYTFSFIVELIIQPFLFIVVLMLSFAESYKEKEPKYKITIKVLSYIVGLITIVFLVHSFNEIMQNSSNFFTKDVLIHFLYPIFYASLFYPFLYLFRLFMQYESLFIRLKIHDLNKKSDYFYVKTKIFLLCGLNLTQLNKFSKGRMFWMKEKEEIDQIISDFKSKK